MTDKSPDPALLAILEAMDHSDPKQWEADRSPNLAYLSTAAGKAVTIADVTAAAYGLPVLRDTKVALDPTKAAAPLPAMAPPADDEEDSKPDPSVDGPGVLVTRKEYTLDDAAADREALAALDEPHQAALTALDQATNNMREINRKRDALITRINSIGPSKDQDLHSVVRKVQEQSLADNLKRAEINDRLRQITGGALPTTHASPLDAKMAARKGIRRQAARMGLTG